MTYYSGKSVAVTGGCGMVGSRLCEFLVDAGASVTVIDNQSRGNTVIDRVNYIVADATKIDSCKYAFRSGNLRNEPVDIVFNLAASVAGVMYNMNHHMEMFYENMLLQTVPVMAAESVGVKTFVQTSSVCVYSPENQVGSVEPNGLIGEPHKANAGYSLAKRTGEKVVSLSNIPKIVTVRPSNIYGPRDYFDERAHVIPALIRRAVDDPVLDVYGPKDYIREFIYVDDVVKGMLAAAEHGKHLSVYNLGTSGRTKITIGELATKIALLVREDNVVIYHGDSGGGDPERWSNCDLAEKELGWKVERMLDDGLKEVVEWYKETMTKK